MKRYLFVLFPMVLMFSCITPEYLLKTESELIGLNLENSVVNYISIDENDRNASEILKTTIEHIQNKKLNLLRKYLTSLEKSGVSSADIKLSQTLYFVSCNKYSEALKCLQNVPDTAYPKLTELLSIDLRFQVAKTNQTVNYASFLVEYQTLINRYHSDTLLKKIVYIRVRHLRYS